MHTYKRDNWTWAHHFWSCVKGINTVVSCKMTKLILLLLIIGLAANCQVNFSNQNSLAQGTFINDVTQAGVGGWG